MISIILYGRNDNYGYNLHKRAALSLNCMAEVLTGEEDEILFVDYNTPDDFPTFPEAIIDTLTPKARKLTRVLRVRPEVHERLYTGRTHLKALEPISRNVALRRSNPANKWILSTNTDMIFCPKGGDSLTEKVAALEGGFYCAPRFELPETLWEGFDRTDPRGVIAETRACGEELHLNEIVLGSDDILYDAPGDFQLMRRDDLFQIDGFNEAMLLGWHVDSNISKRLKLLHGKVSDAEPVVAGYHCDHTRQVTPMHGHGSPQNDMNEFIASVKTPGVEAQRQSWGLAREAVEEISLDERQGDAYRRAVTSAVGAPLRQSLKAAYRKESFGISETTPEHVLPFLVDLFTAAPRSIRVTWAGPQDQLFDMFVECWNALGFAEPPVSLTHCADPFQAIEEAEVMIFNFGSPAPIERRQAKKLREHYAQAIASEARRFEAGEKLRRIVAVNAIHNRFESIITNTVGCSKTPFSARIRHGFALERALTEFEGDMTSTLRPGKAGRFEGDIICSRSSTKMGSIARGEIMLPQAGCYRIIFDLEIAESPTRARFSRLLPHGAAISLKSLGWDNKKMTRGRYYRVAPGRQTLALEIDAQDLDFGQSVRVRLRKFSEGVWKVHALKVEAAA